jgi:hypothetical protein
MAVSVNALKQVCTWPTEYSLNRAMRWVNSLTGPSNGCVFWSRVSTVRKSLIFTRPADAFTRPSSRLPQRRSTCLCCLANWRLFRQLEADMPDDVGDSTSLPIKIDVTRADLNDWCVCFHSSKKSHYRLVKRRAVLASHGRSVEHGIMLKAIDFGRKPFTDFARWYPGVNLIGGDVFGDH